MVTTNRPRHILPFGLFGTLLISCTAQLDELRLDPGASDEPEAVATDHQELDGTQPVGSEVPDESNLGGTEGTSTAPDPVAPTCSDGLLDSQGFCVPEVHCAPGTFITDTDGSPACSPCSSGSFSVAYDATECVSWKDCALGEFVAVVASSSNDRSCEVCAEGETTTVMNAGECSGSNDCPAGSFKQGEGCSPCSPGSYCSGKTESEGACEANTWDHDLDPGTPCVVMTTCAAGQFVQDDGSTTTDQVCEFCPSETFSAQMNAKSCEAWSACTAGSHIEVQGTTSSDRVCAVCETGTFSGIDNAAACATWTTCVAPEQYVEHEPSASADRTCGACPEGQGAPSDNAFECAAIQPANLVSNGDFEAGSDGWNSWNGGVLSISSAKAHSGTQSLLVTGPKAGPAATVLDAVAQAGASYVASFWVSVGKVSTSQVNITRSLVCDGSTTYLWLADNSAVSETGWSNLRGSFTIPSDCASPKLTLYAEGSGTNVDLYVDDVSVTLTE